MLIEFRVENHRSLKTEQVLTMEAGRVDGDSTIPRTVPGYSKPLLPVAALYGANASGKSNVLSALAFMRRAVVDSLFNWAADDHVPRDPFAWGDAHEQPSLYEATILQDGVRYQYGFVVSDQCVEEEWLFAWPKAKKQVWFRRQGQKFTFGEELRLSGARRWIEKVTKSNALFLAVGNTFGHQQLKTVYGWFNQLQTVGIEDFTREAPGQLLILDELRRNEIHGDAGHASRTETDDSQLMDDFRNLLFHADIGIVDIRLDRVVSESELKGRSERLRFLLKHQGNSEDTWLTLDRESRGTRVLFHRGPLVIRTLRLGGVVIVDELESSLHPNLAMKIVQQFIDPIQNPKHAQLIFTTHDTNLLGNTLGPAVLRRDQVWLTEKDPTGGSVLYPLTDFKPRKPENLERGYLQGRYGAIPFLGTLSLSGIGG